MIVDPNIVQNWALYKNVNNSLEERITLWYVNRLGEGFWFSRICGYPSLSHPRLVARRIPVEWKLLSGRCDSNPFANSYFRSFFRGVGPTVERERSQTSSRAVFPKSSSTHSNHFTATDRLRWATITQTSQATRFLRPPPTALAHHAYAQLTISPIPSAPPSSRPPTNRFQFKCPLCFLLHPSQAFLNEHMRKEHAVLIWLERSHQIMFICHLLIAQIKIEENNQLWLYPLESFSNKAIFRNH